MSVTGQELSKAIQILAKGVQVSYDRTYEMVISDIVDIETGAYRVSMEGNEQIPAVCVDGLKGKLSIGDTVLVKVPNGDFSSISDTTTNLIEYKLKGALSDAEALQELMNSYYDSGVKASDIYIYNTNEVGLIAGEHDTITINVPSSASDRAAADKLFSTYAENYKYMRLSARFKTSLNDAHTIGRYGIKAFFEDAEGNEKEYLLGFDSFVGTPYNYPFYNTQEAIFDLSLDSIRKLLRFEFFEIDFNHDHIQGVENTTIPNLFADMIDIQFVDKLEIEPNSYYLYIQTPNGTILKNSGDSVELIGKLVYNTTYLNLTQCECYWYREDASITVNSEEYDKFAGVGWKRINSESSDRITVNYEDVITTNNYKLIVVYNKITATAQVSVVRYNALYDFAIELIIENNIPKLHLLDQNGEEELLGNWFATLPSGQYLQVDQEKDTIDISSFSIYSFVNFSCEVYLAEDSEKSIIGIANYFLDNTIEEEDDGIIVSFIGADLYHYDANGQITIEESERQRALRAEVYMATGEDPLSIVRSKAWYINDIQITGTPYSPENSMMENMWVDTNDNLMYNIRKVFRSNYINNQVKLVVTTFDGQEHAFFKDFTFLKDGDQGTNGSIYSAIIRPYQVSGGSSFTPIPGFSALVYNNNQWGAPLRLAPYVYQEEELLNPSEYSCTWSLPNNLLTLTPNIDGAGFPHGCLIQGNNSPTIDANTANLEYWVKATITINGEIIYCSYPVNVVLGELTGTLDISSVASYIKYTSSGYKPEYQNTEIDISYNNSNQNTDIAVLTTNLLKLSTDKKRLYPATSFNYYQAPTSNDSHIGILKIVPDINNTSLNIVHPVIMYLNTYGNEAINSWDGTQLEIDENGQYILAPQIGAGRKENDNTFTGVVMGVNKGGGDDLANKVGLYGYQHGVASFGLMEDGTAFFGKASSGGRISIDGNNGIISGGDVDISSTGRITPAEKGMYLQLADKSSEAEGVTSETKAIGIGYDDQAGSENFYVTYDGKMYAKGATVNGSIDATAFSINGQNVIYNQKINGGMVDRSTLYVDAANILGSLNVDVLYGSQGDVVDLTVDRLKTSRRIPKYLAGDTSDDNFIYIHGQSMHYIAGVYNNGTEQARNPYGQLLYWEDDISGLSFNLNGYPIRSDGTQVFTTVSRTNWPVTVYSYTEHTKASFDFVLNSSTGYYEPKIVLGEGDQAGNNKAIIYKGSDSLQVLLSDKNGNDVGMESKYNGYLDLYGLRRAKSLDFSEWNNGSFTETLDGDIENSFIVTFDEQGRPVTITEEDGHVLQITW